MTASLRRARHRAKENSPPVLHTPLFRDLAAELDSTEQLVVLDLGAASTEMLALLGRTRCRADVADLAHFGGVDLLNSTEPGPALAGLTESLLPNRLAGDPIDLVLCWDLPNYLTLAAMSALMKAIAGRARPGAIAHALIFYAENDMPAQPGRYVPTAEADLIDRSTTSEMIAAPRYSPEDLSQGMDHFVIDRARLLSNGMQEFIFRLGF